MKVTFKSAPFQNKPTDAFNEVQAGNLVVIEHRSRPDMVLMLSSERDSMLGRIFELQQQLEKPIGDSINQLDLLEK